MMLHCNIISHWLSPWPEWSLRGLQIPCSLIFPQAASLILRRGKKSVRIYINIWCNWGALTSFKYVLLKSEKTVLLLKQIVENHIAKHFFKKLQSAFQLFVHQLVRVTNKEKHQCFTLLTLCEGNPPTTSGFPSQRASNPKHVSVMLRIHQCLVDSPNKEPIMLKSFACHDWIMIEASSLQ